MGVRDLLRDAEEQFRHRLPEPTAGAVTDVTVRQGNNAAGEPSLFLRLVFKRDLRPADSEAISQATLALASWLGEQGHSELYPYINITTVQEEAEERQAG